MDAVQPDPKRIRLSEKSSEGPSSICPKLPFEILSFICFYLPDIRNVLKMRRVCKEWKAVVHARLTSQYFAPIGIETRIWRIFQREAALQSLLAKFVIIVNRSEDLLTPDEWGIAKVQGLQKAFFKEKLPEETQFSNVVKQKTIAPIQSFIDQSPLLIHSKNAFTAAIKTGEQDIVAFFIERGADVNVDIGGTSPLHIAAYKGNINIVEILVNNGADLFCFDDGRTPLEVASSAGHDDIVNFLKEKSGKNSAEILASSLIIAVGEQNLDLVVQLVNDGADVNFPDEFGDKPLTTAVEEGNLAIAKFLVANGAIINDDAIKTSVDLGYYELVQFFLQNGADIHRVYQNRSLIESAIESEESVKIVSLLLEHGANPNQMIANGETILFKVIRKKDEESFDLAKALITNGANVNHQNDSGLTPLHLAVEQDCIKTSRLLLENGANLTLKNSSGQRAFDIALQKNNREMIQLFEQFSLSPLQQAIKEGNHDRIRHLVEEGADLEYRSLLGKTALHFLAEKGNGESLCLLLSKGVLIDQQNNGGITPLHIAAHKGDLEITKLLLEAGANTKIQSQSGKDAYIYAISQGHLQVANLIF